MEVQVCFRCHCARALNNRRGSARIFIYQWTPSRREYETEDHKCYVCLYRFMKNSHVYVCEIINRQAELSALSEGV
jgi:hypothetical protein